MKDCARLSALFSVLLVLTACTSDVDPTTTVSGTAGRTGLDGIAETYVRLVLRLGEHDAAFVDAYYGPEAWREEAAAAPGELSGIAGEARRLIESAKALAIVGDDPLVEMRRRYLTTQLGAVAARAEILAGARYAFDEETRLLYDAVSPPRDTADFERVLGEIDALVPGDGPLAGRVADFRKAFEIPAERLAAVFDAAIAECKRRTQQHVRLPEGERFTVEYVTDKPWSGYNWYQGEAYSLIQVNTDLPMRIDRAVDLGCHEGYPGHHTYNALLEQRLVRERGWPEFSIYALFSPQSLIAEGSANYGQEIAFPGEARTAFEREVLFPLAGLDESRAETYYAVERLINGLSYVTNEVARRYLDGEIDRAEAVRWLIDYQLRTPEAAEQGLDFIETYRGYVINYNLGKDMVQDWVERQAANGGHDERWRIFSELLSSPRLPSDLTE